MRKDSSVIKQKVQHILNRRAIRKYNNWRDALKEANAFVIRSGATLNVKTEKVFTPESMPCDEIPRLSSEKDCLAIDRATHATQTATERALIALREAQREAQLARDLAVSYSEMSERGGEHDER